MSELTECNYCTFRRLEQRYGAENVKLVPSTDLPGWVDVLRNAGTPDKPMWTRVGVSFVQVTMHCVC
jgi:hypothetical protein